MKKWLFAQLLIIAGVVLVYSQKVEFTEFDLDNGLHVILHQDNSAPIVTVGFMADVGGKDLGGDNNSERTGFAHFFEHLLASAITENIQKGEWRKIRGSRGGNGNANTTLDRTYYYQTFPSNNLEFALWMDSERLVHPIIDKDAVETQNEVVKEEKRWRVDNSPYGHFFEVVLENLFKNHPYKYTPIGEMEHLDAATVKEFQDYFNRYYVPSNLVLVVAGDIEIDKTKELVRKYYSAIPEGEVIKRNFPKEAPITETIETTFYDPNIQLPAIIAAYRTPGHFDKDSYALNMLSNYLSNGKSSVLYKKMVDEQKQALQASLISLNLIDYSINAIIAIPQGDVSLETLLSEIDEEIVKVQHNLISERDFEKLQNQFESQFLNSNSSIEGIASSLATYYMLHDDINLINNELEIYRSLTREDLKRVANEYLKPNQRAVIKYLPKNDSE